MDKSFRIVVALLLVSVCLAGCSATPQQATANEINLINASAKLANFDIAEVKPGGSWAMENGIVVSSGAGESYLVIPGEYSNFLLTMEFKPDATINSGVYMRCQDKSLIKANTCYEANIWDAAKNQTYRTGSIVKRQTFAERLDTKNRWNTYEISMINKNITVRLNGVVTAEMDSVEYKKGFIAIQHKGTGSIQIRSLRIKAL